MHHFFLAISLDESLAEFDEFLLYVLSVQPGVFVKRVP